MVQRSIYNPRYWSFLSLPKQSPFFNPQMWQNINPALSHWDFMTIVLIERRETSVCCFKWQRKMSSEQFGISAGFYGLEMSFVEVQFFTGNIVTVPSLPLSLLCVCSVQSIISFTFLLKWLCIFYISTPHKLCMSHNTTPGCLNMYLLFYTRKTSPQAARVQNWKKGGIEKGFCNGHTMCLLSVFIYLSVKSKSNCFQNYNESWW